MASATSAPLEESTEKHVSATSVDFHHPYTPYDIQETFMKTVYQVLEESKVGILESPTGTVSARSHYLGSYQRLKLARDFLYFALETVQCVDEDIGEITQSNLWIADLAPRSQRQDVRKRA